MKRMKNTLAALVAVMMLISCFTISAGAAELSMKERYGDFVDSAIATYFQDFSNVDNVNALGSYDSGYSGTTEVNGGVLTLTDSNSTPGGELKFNFEEFHNYGLMSPEKLFCVELDIKLDAGLGKTNIWVLNSNDIELNRSTVDYRDGEVRARNANAGEEHIRFFTDEVKNGESLHLKYIFDMENSKWYWWVNGIACVEGYSFFNGVGGVPDKLRILSGDADGATGTVYIDNLKVSGLCKKDMPAPVTTSYLYNQDFESFDLGDADYIAVTADSSLVTSGVFNTAVEGGDASKIDEIFIEKDAEGGKVMRITTQPGDNQPHCYYFANALDGSFSTNNGANFVLKYKVKTTSPYQAHIGIASDKWRVASFEMFDGGVLVSNGSGGIGVNETMDVNLLDGKWHEVTWLIDIDADGDTNEKYSIWVDGQKVKSEGLTNGNVTGAGAEGFPICFRTPSVPGAVSSLWVDDIRFFEASEDYMSLDALSKNITKLSDVAVLDTEDGDIKDLRNAADIGINGEVSFTDNNGYVNSDGDSIVFPMDADKTDLTVAISAGGVTWTKNFYDVVIREAYTFNADAKRYVDNILAQDNFVVGSVTAKVRNSTSDIHGRIKVVAAIYDKETKQMLKVQLQDDVLDEKEAFECKLDLAEFSAEQLENAEVKLFVWENNSFIPMI